ncbi:MAG: hypothetical protein NTZ48_00200 [Candidatus Omnitrophica bacterium]|nr:hypothetical protein [Candidatus Omnitrophota bacterium]
MIVWIDNLDQYWHCTGSTTWAQYLGQQGPTGPAGPTGEYISSVLKSSNYPITDVDGYTTIFISGNTTITLPRASIKRIIKFVKTDAGTTATITRSGSDTIAGEISFTTTNRYNTTTLESDGLTTWYVF